jgi:hypothetical protein
VSFPLTGTQFGNSTVPSAGYPRRALAGVLAFVALATGWFVALHVLGVCNIVFGRPRITPSAVMFASVIGLSVTAEPHRACPSAARVLAAGPTITEGTKGNCRPRRGSVRRLSVE